MLFVFNDKKDKDNPYQENTHLCWSIDSMVQHNASHTISTFFPQAAGADCPVVFTGQGYIVVVASSSLKKDKISTY